MADSPPPQAPNPVSGFERVICPEEVCDPCESEDRAYLVNGVKVSDFITPHYYDPNGASGVRYSFSGKVQAPHTVLEGGYVSFGNPGDNHWYQIIVRNNQRQARDLGVLNGSRSKSLREQVDRLVRKKRRSEYYRTRSPTGKPPSKASSLAETSAARAKALRSLITNLK